MEFWTTYSTAAHNPDISDADTLQTICETGWQGFLSEDQSPAFDYLSDDFFKSINSLGTDMLNSVEYFAATNTTTWDSLVKEYFDSLRTKVKTNVKPLDAKDKSNIATNIKIAFVRKLQWMSFAHGSTHYAPFLPLITPSVLNCIEQVFQQIPKALLEVCLFDHHSSDELTSISTVHVMGITPRSVFRHDLEEPR